MGGRLSVPSGPGGTTEASRIPRNAPRRMPINARTLLGPIGVISLAGLFFVYSRTSIQAAKVNAQRHREADGGTISWRNEALRRHGALAKPQERTLWQQLFAGKEDPGKTEEERRKTGETEGMKRRREERNPIEEGLRRARDRSQGSNEGGEG